MQPDHILKPETLFFNFPTCFVVHLFILSGISDDVQMGSECEVLGKPG